MAQEIDVNPPFDAPTQKLSFAGLLFDMDGTIIDSTAAVEQHWTEIGRELGVDPNIILATSHGRRSIDILEKLDPTKATWDYVREIEGVIPARYGSDATEIPGSRALLEALASVDAPWAIVTSGTRPLVTGWLDVMSLAHPAHLVTAEDVLKGKPDPSCYQLGREKLNLPEDTNDDEILVLEDAPAGVKAGKAAGFRVVGLATSHSVDQLKEAGADWIVKDMSSVVFDGWDEKSAKVGIAISNALVF